MAYGAEYLAHVRQSSHNEIPAEKHNVLRWHDFCDSYKAFESAADSPCMRIIRHLVDGDEVDRVQLAKDLVGPDKAHRGFLSYVQSNCNPRETRREEMYDMLVGFAKENGWPTPHAGGECTGKHSAHTRLQERDRYDGKAAWGKVYEATIFMHARNKFALAFENSKHGWYFSEKIWQAFSAGVVPLYYGTDDIFEVFNKDAFIYLDPRKPETGLAKIKAAMEDEEVYMRYLRAPLLMPRAKEEWLSGMSWHIGGGKIMRDVRTALGLAPADECVARDRATSTGGDVDVARFAAADLRLGLRSRTRKGPAGSSPAPVGPGGTVASPAGTRGELWWLRREQR